MRGVFVCIELLTATGPDACWEDVGVGIIDRHVSGRMDGLKERRSRTGKKCGPETHDVYLKQECKKK